MKVFAINSNYNQTPFAGKKKKYDKLPDYQNYHYERDTYGSIDSLPKERAENAIKLIKNKDLKIIAQNYYDTEHYMSPNAAGFVLGMDAGLENIKDKFIKNEIKSGLKHISKNIEKGEKYYDNDEGINLISDMVDTYNTLNGNYSRYFIPESDLDIVKYKLSPVKHYMEVIDSDMPHISERTHQDLNAIFEHTKNYKCTTNAKDIVENQRTEAYSYIAKYPPFNNYMYIKYYLNTNKISPEVRKMCLDILNQFGTQVILSDTDKNNSIKDLKEIKKELNLWKKYGKDEARFPYIINLSRIDNSYTDLSKYWGTIYLGDDVIFGAKNLNLHDQQDIYNGTYFASVLYVTGGSVSPGALGLTDDDPISFGDALTHVKDGVDTRIIFAKGNYEFDKTYSIANKNITLVGNNSYIKRNNNDKSLFIPRITPKLLSMKKVKKVLLIQIIFYHFPSCKNPPFYEFAQQ